MLNSLVDSSTETFWESRDEPRSKTKALMVTFNDDKKLYAAAIHNDNGKDSGVCTYDIVHMAHIHACNMCTHTHTHFTDTIIMTTAKDHWTITADWARWSTKVDEVICECS